MPSNPRVAAKFLRALLPGDRHGTRALLAFLAAWTLLNVTLNLRYPGGEKPLWYLLPSWDVVAVFGVFAAIAWKGWRVPKPALVALVVAFCLVRVLRFGDGVKDRYFSETVTLYRDVPLVPELVRFAHSTLPTWEFWLLVAAIAGFAVVLPLVLYRALTVVDRFLSVRANLPLVGLLALVGFLIGMTRHAKNPRYGQLLAGGFGKSAVPRIYREGSFVARVFTEQPARVRAIDRVGEELRRTPSNLAKLGGRNVYLFFVESYGEAAIELPAYARTIRPSLAAFEQELRRRGFSVASSRLASPTYGGSSWLAHATLATGVKTTDQFEYDLLLTVKPKPIAAFFREAGYRTVLVQPASTRPWPQGDVFGFDKRYSARDFNYRGPKFGWATMPDQYVLDFMYRHEIAGHRRPLFVEYVLVSSHAPWSDLPTPVDDWSRLGDGSIYRSHPALHFPVVLTDLSTAGEAYARSIAYDFDILRRYLSERINDDSLVILLGDHQPVPELSGHSASRAVPIHVLSRNRGLVETFVGRGYAWGMWPRRSADVRGFERFLPDLLRDFSTSHSSSAAVRSHGHPTPR